MLIVYINHGSGWDSITKAVNLAVELFEADLLVLDTVIPKAFEKLEILLLKRKKLLGAESCLLICPDATGLIGLTRITNWRKRFKYLAAWVVDSFWLERIPKVVKLSHQFDHFFISTEEDIPAWTAATKTPVSWLPCGSDVLRLGGISEDKVWDLTRIGRQPDEWDDDANTEKLCTKKNIRFHGRMKTYESPEKNQQMLMGLYKQSKFLLAFTNIAHPNIYTHATRQYITARWTDALACGAVVAGMPPNEPSINRLFWDGATLDIKSTHIVEGLEIIDEALKQWKPEQAVINHQLALERLDWRWRLAEIALVLNEKPKKLNLEIQMLNQKIAIGKNKSA